jgi:hypothetical protein
MLDARTLELINGRIDGVLKPEEQAELEDVLATSVEARAMQADLQKLSNLLDGMPEQSPPPELADRILEQLPLLDRRPTFSLAGWFSSLQPAPLGLAFAAGLLLTVGVYEMSPGHRSETDPASIVGTMVANMQSQPASQKDSLVISTPGLSGTVSLSSSGHLQVLNFDLESADVAEIVIALAESGLVFGGIAHATASESNEYEIYEVLDGTLRVTNQGRRAFSVFLLEQAGSEGDDREISIGISSGGAPIFSGVLRG